MRNAVRKTTKALKPFARGCERHELLLERSGHGSRGVHAMVVGAE